MCRDVRYETTANPIWTTVCHCTFCQKITGSAFLVEPIFKRTSVVFSGTAPKTFDHRSDGSGLRVTLNFCGRCSTTLYLAFERFPDHLGVCAGTFDDPNWFDRGPEKCRHIFTRSAQRGVVLPAGFPTFIEHALRSDGTFNEPIVLAEPRMVSRTD
ncbi:MAG TPA: GFA family protein [Polyangiales bacterium]|nr:GFA family protein [Polyangiales bacterium]